MIDLPVRAVVCGVHGEVFRLKWPFGYVGFALTAAQKVIETSSEIAEATGGDTRRLNGVIAEFGPLCRLLTPELRREAYKAGAEISKDWAERAICDACGKWKLGARGLYQPPRGPLVERHVCLDCVSGQRCQSE